jgi:superfamily I DNA and/or RNA helicase
MKKKKTSVGIVSAYAAQVIALQERVQSYKKHAFLSVEVCTVDSCQGNEKDIFILSTVRHNNGGNIGFLNCDKRTNVALTRAKYVNFCLLFLLAKDQPSDSQFNIPVHIHLNNYF